MCAPEAPSQGAGAPDGSGDDSGSSDDEANSSDDATNDEERGVEDTSAADTRASEDTGTDTAADTTDSGGGDDDPWLPGAPAGLIAAGELLDLPAAPSGPPIWVSNNPERFTGEGWLVQHARSDPQRGGAADPLRGTVPVYLFHLNGSGAAKWLHLVASNPQDAPISVSLLGSLYTNGEHPLDGPGTGPSYAVSRDWLEGQLPVDVGPTPLPPLAGAVLLSRPVGAAQMVDGRFELSSPDAGAYLYAVVTGSSDPVEAINATQGAHAPGEILEPGPNAYGREAGVYEHGTFDADVALTLPEGAGHLGYCFNTAAKFAWQGETLQEQTAAARTVLDDSAERSWGNYGHRLRVELELVNPGGSPRTVSLELASHFTADEDAPSFTWSAPMRVGPLGQAEIVDVWTTPTQPVDALGSWEVPAMGGAVLVVETVVPGLITAGQQLRVIAE